ncbi:hypothetical protein [Microbacterium paraoxydans]|uniref:hypothetical protein n=1 Tax=Microbacterium paraoxydans TaxID=199592 RepID=UPI001CF94139|nr:hypothetical protein [Microbacterium paraoxydans]
MSGLEIGHGGAIAVDTGQLRDLGSRLRGVAERYEETRAAVLRAQEAILSAPAACPEVDVNALGVSVERLGALRAELDDACVGTELMADAFEVVELRAEVEALALTDAAAAAVAEARLAQLVSGDERVGVMAAWLVEDWEDRRFQGVGRQFDAGGLLSPLFFAGAFIGVTTGLGAVGTGAPLKGQADPVRVTAVKASTPAAPQDLAGALRRMPSATAQVAVEKYTMSDGATRYVTYISGTRNGVPWAGGEEEPWDMKSNVELYQGHRSASYQATLDALAAAGAEPGDRVDVVAYSQGGMIAAHLATESPYDVGMQVTAGSPQQPLLGDDQTLIQLRHSDDLVSNLAAGGSAAGTGSADSFTATRVGDPRAGLQDLALRAHALETYIETAEMVDASDDPRAEALDAYWAELATAAEVERTEYRAERTPR